MSKNRRFLASVEHMSNTDNKIYMKRSEIDNVKFNLLSNFNKTEDKTEDNTAKGVQIGIEILIPTVIGLLIGLLISSEYTGKSAHGSCLGKYAKYYKYIFPLIGAILGIIFVSSSAADNYFKRNDIFSKFTIRYWSKILFYKVFIIACIYYILLDYRLVKTLTIDLANVINIGVFVFIIFAIMLFINLGLNFYNEDKEDNIYINYSDVINTFLRLILTLSVLFGLFFYIKGLSGEYGMKYGDSYNFMDILKNVDKINATIISKQKLWFEIPFVILALCGITVLLKVYTYNKFHRVVRNIIKDEQFSEKCPVSLNINVNSSTIPTTYYNKSYKLSDCLEKYGDKCHLYARDFYWPCSYNSFSIDGSNYGGTSYLAIKRSVLLGARVLHLKLFLNSESEMEIGMKQNINGSNLDIVQTFQIIKDTLWNKIDTKQPLIIYLDFDSKDDSDMGTIPLDRLYDKIITIFSDRLVDQLYGFNGRSSNPSGDNPLGSIPIIKMLGTVAFITNKYPTNSDKLNGIVNGCISKSQDYINSLTLNRGETISHVDFNKSSTIDHNKHYMTAIFPGQINSSANIVKSGVSLFNLEYQTNWDWGCQFVFMNYQICDINDKNNILIKYINEFKNSSLILKPDELRYMPVKQPTIPKQSESASFAPVNMKILTGWHPEVNL